MAHHEPERHKRAFEASHTTVFIYYADRLIGFGRAISDGIYQAAVYDCAVLLELQGQGIGSTIMNSIMDALPDCNVILCASPGVTIGDRCVIGAGAVVTSDIFADTVAVGKTSQILNGSGRLTRTFNGT